MSEALFNIVFKGRFTSNIDKSKAVLHFSKLFKLPQNKAELFFDGKARTLKKDLNLDQASHFRKALKKAGLRVSLVKQISQEKSQKQLTLSEVGVVIVNKPFKAPKKFDTSQLHLDEVGIKIVEAKKVEAREFDLQGLQLDEVGVQMTEKKETLKPDYDLTGLSIDKVGAIISHKQKVPPPELDISDLSVDEVGATLVKKKKTPKTDINTDNISLS